MSFARFQTIGALAFLPGRIRSMLSVLLSTIAFSGFLLSPMAMKGVWIAPLALALISFLSARPATRDENAFVQRVVQSSPQSLSPVAYSFWSLEICLGQYKAVKKWADRHGFKERVSDEQSNVISLDAYRRLRQCPESCQDQNTCSLCEVGS